VPVKIALGGWDRLFDSVSNGRSHNGYVLEASPIPQLPITSLEMVDDPRSKTFRVALDAQSKEEIAVNGSDSYISRASIPSDSYLDPKLSSLSSSNGPSPQYPLLLLLDGVVDPNNVGSIIRSAYYLGVDGIILAGRNSSPLNPTVSKTAAGAIENTTFLTVRNDHDFVRTSQANGWRFLAADSPEAAASSGFYAGAETPHYAAQSVLLDAPTILMLGNESDGLLKRLKNQADATISIPGSRFQADLSRQDPARVDSLNVGVAASLLIEMLLRVPLQICWNPSKQRGPREAGLQATSSFDFN
jgi:21S rRNA (GM2251-2'-O)-methyltransferase